MIARPAEAFYIALRTFIIDKGLMPSSFCGEHSGDNVCSTPVTSGVMQKQNLKERWEIPEFPQLEVGRMSFGMYFVSLLQKEELLMGRVVN